jgi:hypothetical protein
MHPTYRRELLALMAETEQLITEAERLSVEVPDDEILLRASKQLAELRQVLAKVEGKLRQAN